MGELAGGLWFQINNPTNTPIATSDPQTMDLIGFIRLGLLL
jgi:hypothetical protein